MGGSGYTIKRNFPFAREIVWEAWTDPEAFATWFGTDKVKMKDVKLDVKVGGNWKGTMVLDDGTETHWTGQYQTIDKPSKLVMSITDTGVLTGNLETYSLTLDDQGQKKTQMTLTQSGGNLSDEEYKRAKAGTESFMDTMEAKVLPVLKARHDAM
jgi:uncharacterized protein YndB with AHSA1/START domain